MSKVTVEGTVTRVFSKGFEVTETYTTKDQREFTQRFTVWDATASEGDRVSVTGDLGAKVEEWTGRDDTIRHSVKLSINRPTVNPTSPAGVVSGAGGYSDPSTDSWGAQQAQTGYGDDTPF